MINEADTKLNHIAFIMDGNGRWAKKRGLAREAGHKAGAANFRKIVDHCRAVGIKTVTAYAFSTENWSRPAGEVAAIMRLIDDYIKEAERDRVKNKIRYVFLGDKSALAPDLREKTLHLEELTRDCPLTLNIALNYGGRAEITNAVNELIAEGRTSVTESDIASRLYTAHSGDPDFIVRTGAELRLSNFLLWQSAYAELYFTETLWPDFTVGQLDDAINEYYRRQRRFGRV